jgi:hypothetical protein
MDPSIPPLLLDLGDCANRLSSLPVFSLAHLPAAARLDDVVVFQHLEVLAQLVFDGSIKRFLTLVDEVN